MNASHENEPLSLVEFAMGAVAVAAVAAIAFHGVMVSQSRDQSSAKAIPPWATLSSPRLRDASQRAGPRRHRHTPYALVRTRQGPAADGVTRRETESSALDSAALDPPAVNPAEATGAPGLDFFAEADPATGVMLLTPDMADPPFPLIGPPDLFQMKDAVSVQRLRPAADAADPPPAGARDPSNRPDAVWIQTKLRDLGYYAGNVGGAWGPASRNALRDFKTMNGLPEDDKWDPATEQRLLSRQRIRASSTFIGGWAKDIEECQHPLDGGAPLKIRARGAETNRGRCDFRSVKREAAAVWRIHAACSAEASAWNANISLKLTGSNLNWSSERGTETYVRCLKP